MANGIKGLILPLVAGVAGLVIGGIGGSALSPGSANTKLLLQIGGTDPTIAVPCRGGHRYYTDFLPDFEVPELEPGMPPPPVWVELVLNPEGDDCTEIQEIIDPGDAALCMSFQSSYCSCVNQGSADAVCVAGMMAGCAPPPKPDCRTSAPQKTRPAVKS